MKVHLTPKTQKGKNRIREAGTGLWDFIEEMELVLFSSKIGPWFLIQPGNNTKMARWVHHKEDEHFEVELCPQSDKVTM